MISEGSAATAGARIYACQRSPASELYQHCMKSGVIRNLTKMYSIEAADQAQYNEIVDLWEASVRATHSFVTEDDILEFKPLILNQYLGAVNLKYVKEDSGRIVGFLGVVGDSLEMLFLHPDFMGRGIGRMLVEHAIKDLKTTRVDVNEQNPNAVKFYQNAGFKIVGRSELDSTGRPYPILHMQLSIS